MEFILASSNPHKADEFNDLFKDAPISVNPASKKIDVIEDGNTFNENAFKKAKAYYDEFKSPALADDSGLVVPSLPDILGVHSARFSPELPDYKDKNLKLIELIDGKDRAAYFVCYLCFYINPQEVYFFEGRVHGQIGNELQGEDGFGYDPVFLPDGQDGKSLAQVIEWKMTNSHRAKASIAASNFFSNR
ncbi:MAG: non-canonical purine NTP pyrophosphatase [Bacteriovoracaceae bacterium]|jgi:XTP/dITP diphosphohydrolase|nr:non-canonical purine NTP pyrophosphatase [Bacteriovoracaceae bacterium]